MKSLIAFWKRDIINKLIVIVMLALAGAGLAFIWLIFNMPQGMSLQDAFSDFIPARATPTFNINSYLTPGAMPPALIATATEAYVSAPTFTPFVPPPVDISTPAINAPTPAPELIPTLAAASPTQQIQPTDFGCIPNNPRQTGRVVEVLDGNTVRVLLKETGLIYTVRYAGVTAPEDKIFGEAAKQKNTAFVYGQDKEIVLIQDQTDKDDRGRLLRYALVDNTFVNLELIRQGLGSAANVSDLACAQVFKQAEQAAQAALTGMWTPKP